MSRCVESRWSHSTGIPSFALNAGYSERAKKTHEAFRQHSPSQPQLIRLILILPRRDDKSNVLGPAEFRSKQSEILRNSTRL